jgi:hypothetical protein
MQQQLHMIWILCYNKATAAAEGAAGYLGLESTTKKQQQHCRAGASCPVDRAWVLTAKLTT